MNYLKTTCFFISILLASISINAQNVSDWNLQKCIDYALKNNIQIKQSQLNSDAEKLSLQQTKANVLPSINGSIYHGYNLGRRIDPFTNQFADSKVLSQNYSLSGNINLFSGFQNYNSIRQYQYGYEASKFDIEKLKNDIILNVTAAYMQILFSEELLNTSKSQLDVTNKQLEQMQKFVAAGVTTKSSLLDVQSQLASEELNLTTVQNQLDNSYLNLIQLMNLDSVASFKIAKPKIEIMEEPAVLLNSSQLYSNALNTLPEVKSAELRYLSSEKAYAASKGSISPRLSLGGSIGSGYSGLNKEVTSITPLGFIPNGSVTDSGGYVYSQAFDTKLELKPFKEQFDENINKNFGFSLTIPIFNNLQYHSSISRAKIQKQIADYSLQATKQSVFKTIQQAQSDLMAAFKKYNASLKAKNAMQESYSYVQQKFDLGLITSLEYVTAKSRLAKTDSDLLQAKYDYIFKSKIVDFYQGKSIIF